MIIFIVIFMSVQVVSGRHVESFSHVHAPAQNPHLGLSKNLIKAQDFLQPFNDTPYNVIS